jgi:hypothetical protein
MRAGCWSCSSDRKRSLTDSILDRMSITPTASNWTENHQAEERKSVPPRLDERSPSRNRLRPTTIRADSRSPVSPASAHSLRRLLLWSSSGAWWGDRPSYAGSSPRRGSSSCLLEISAIRENSQVCHLCGLTTTEAGIADAGSARHREALARSGS